MMNTAFVLHQHIKLYVYVVSWKMTNRTKEFEMLQNTTLIGDSTRGQEN
jgi:hypothetical protein